mgnify:FL=1|uniref:Branched-chain amino acid ABC transporter permease n=1 Tax=Geoglobus ahangari TaxID=113653 RepID=A0A7C4W370_9EURY
MALSFLYNFFVISVMALMISLNFRLSKFLNLSLAGFFAAGSYIAYFYPNLIAALILGGLFGFGLSLIIMKYCESVIEATISSLGFGLLIERILYFIHESSYYYILNYDLSWLSIPATLTVFAVILFLYLTKNIGLKLKFVESDIELAEIYGVDTTKIKYMVIILTSATVTCFGFIYASLLAITPTIGFGYLISGIIVSAFAAQLKLNGIYHYVSVIALSFVLTRIFGVIL